MKQILLTLSIHGSPPRRRCRYPAAGEKNGQVFDVPVPGGPGSSGRDAGCGMMDARILEGLVRLAGLLAGDSRLKGEKSSG